MKNRKIKCAIMGGGEPELYVLGELHRRRDVEIAFVYDRNPAAVALEIAEILRVPRISRPEDIPVLLPVDCVVVGEPRSRYTTELAAFGNAEILGHDAALQRFGRTPASAPPAPAETPADSLEDTLAGFERLFDRERLLQFLLGIAVEATSAANGSIMLYSPEAEELYIAYATGLSERVVRNTRQKLGEGIAGTVAQERHGKLIRQAAIPRHYAGQRDRASIDSACSVPLLDGDTLLGVLNVSAGAGGRELGVADLRTLEKLSRRMARVLADSLRLQEFRLRREEMTLRQSLGELSEKSGTTAEKFALLSALVANMTGAESVEVFVSTQTGEWMVLGGSSRRITAAPELVKVGRGALARAFLDRRTITLTEPVDPQSGALASSFVFVPLVLSEALGVVVIEFAERHRLDEFLAVKDSVALELSRFIAGERRERRLRGELAGLVKVNEAAPSLLACRTLQDLADVVARLLADALACDRVSLRVRPTPATAWTFACYDSTGRADTWREEDDERFARLLRAGQAQNLTFLDFTPGPHGRSTHSVLAVPHAIGDDIMAAAIAYDRDVATAVEDVAFSRHDETMINHVLAMAWPAIREFAPQAHAARPSYDETLSGNVHRITRVVEAEMERADRYHHPFSLLLVRVPAMNDLFASDAEKALGVADEIRQGIQTRTRKSDYGCWIHRDTYAIVSLEGTRRMPFLVERLVAYLTRDFAGAGVALSGRDILVGGASYPGMSRSPDALLAEARESLKPHAGA